MGGYEDGRKISQRSQRVKIASWLARLPTLPSQGSGECTQSSALIFMQFSMTHRHKKDPQHGVASITQGIRRQTNKKDSCRRVDVLKTQTAEHQRADSRIILSYLQTADCTALRNVAKGGGIKRG